MSRRQIALALLALIAPACAGEPTFPEAERTPEPEPQTIQVQADDYRFTGVPEILPPGETTFVLKNVGQEHHELSMARIKGKKSLEEIMSLPGEKAQRLITQIGGTGAQPWQSAELTVDLQPGRYFYACFVHTDDGTVHAVLGMIGELSVQ